MFEISGEKLYKTLYVLMSLVCAVAIFNIFTTSADKDLVDEQNKELVRQNNMLEKKLESFQMYYYDQYGQKLENEYGLNGLAFPEEHIFCVYTKDRTITEVLETSAHEYGHTNLDMGHNEEIRDLKREIKALKNP